MELLAYSQQIKSEATKLLADGKVIETLKKYGDVITRGSYSVDLMLSRDIDLNVIGPKVGRQQAIQALNDFIGQDFFGSYHYYDWFRFRKPEFPKGYYIGLQAKIGDEKWKIDIWFLTDGDERTLSIMGKLESVDDSTKELILELKQYRTDHGLKINSYQIYEAVLEHSVKTTDQLALYTNSLNLV